VKFDPGVRLGFAGGYQFTDWFALEAQTGVMANRIKSIDGASRVDDATLSNVPLLFNVKFQGPKDSAVSPYIGAGAGTSISIMDADHIDIGATSLRGNQSDAVFAWQAFGGLRFRLNHRMGLSVEYRYFATADPHWEADNSFGTATDQMVIGGTETHSISAVFDFKF
jgi:OmpA-OmpF porin, OOP family